MVKTRTFFPPLKTCVDDLKLAYSPTMTPSYSFFQLSKPMSNPISFPPLISLSRSCLVSIIALLIPHHLSLTLNPTREKPLNQLALYPLKLAPIGPVRPNPVQIMVIIPRPRTPKPLLVRTQFGIRMKIGLAPLTRAGVHCRWFGPW